MYIPRMKGVMMPNAAALGINADQASTPIRHRVDQASCRPGIMIVPEKDIVQDVPSNSKRMTVAIHVTSDTSLPGHPGRCRLVGCWFRFQLPLSQLPYRIL